MRPVRALSLVTLGGFAGFAASAAVLRRALPSRGDAESDEVALVAIYNGIDLKSRAEAFRGGSMLAWFGGIAVDLREATLAPRAHLSVNSLFGGTSRSACRPAGASSRACSALARQDVDVSAPRPGGRGRRRR